MPESEGTAAFGRYRDPVMLGSGGMGAVYRATDPSLNRYVAIKVLTHRDPRYVERFRREAQVLAKIGHPSIIQIYEIVGSDEPLKSLGSISRPGFSPGSSTCVGSPKPKAWMVR